MRWDLGLGGVGLLVALAVGTGVVTHLIWGRGAPRRLWLAASVGYLILGAFVSEVWFGWATGEDLQPNVDGLSFDEVLLLGMLVPLGLVTTARLIARRRRAALSEHQVGGRGGAGQGVGGRVG
jgi:hypothetical protein